MHFSAVFTAVLSFTLSVWNETEVELICLWHGFIYSHCPSVLLLTCHLIFYVDSWVPLASVTVNEIFLLTWSGNVKCEGGVSILMVKAVKRKRKRRQIWSFNGKSPYVFSKMCFFILILYISSLTAEFWLTVSGYVTRMSFHHRADCFRKKLLKQTCLKIHKRRFGAKRGNTCQGI